MSLSDNEEFRENDEEVPGYNYFRYLSGIKPVDSIDLIPTVDPDRDEHVRIITSVIKNPKSYKRLPQKFQDDKDVVCALVHTRPRAIKSLDVALRKDKHVVWHAVGQDPYLLGELGDEPLKDDPLIAFALFKAVSNSASFPTFVLRDKDREWFKEIGKAAKLHFATEPGFLVDAHKTLFRSITNYAFFDDIGIVNLFFKYVPFNEIEKVYNDNLSDEAKILPDVLKALADKNILTLDSIPTTVSIPESVWDSRDTMLELLYAHGNLFRHASTRLRSDGDFVMNVISRNSYRKDAIENIVTFVCGVLRTSQSEFIKWVLSSLARFVSENASIKPTLFALYESWFSDFNFTFQCIDKFLKKQPNIFVEVLKYESLHEILSSLDNVSQIGKCIAAKLYDRDKALSLTKALIAKVAGTIDVETANSILYRRICSIREVFMAMSPKAKRDLAISIMSFGGRDARKLDDCITTCDADSNATQRYTCSVDTLAVNILTRMTLRQNSDFLLCLIDGCSDLETECILSAFMTLEPKNAAGISYFRSHKCDDVYNTLVHWEQVKAYKTLQMSNSTLFSELQHEYVDLAVGFFAEYINGNKEYSSPGEKIMEWIFTDTDGESHRHSLVVVKQPTMFSLICTHTPPISSVPGVHYEVQSLICTSISGLVKFFRDMQRRFMNRSSLLSNMPASFLYNNEYRCWASTAQNYYDGSIVSKHDIDSVRYRSIFSRSTYLRSICYDSQTKIAAKVYTDHAPPIEKNNVSVVLSIMKSTAPRDVEKILSDSVKQEPSIVRQSILKLGRGMKLSDGINQADIDDSLSWRIEKRLLLIAYKNHHDRTDTMDHIYFLRSFYYDLFEFDATAAERNERAVLPKRGKPPAHYVNVIPEHSDDSIQTMSDRRERSDMINAWSHAVGEISRGLKMVETATSKGKSTSVQTLDDQFSSASVTITKLCEKINDFLCRTTGQAQIVDMMYDMHEIDEDDADEKFVVQQKAAINTLKAYNKGKRKRAAVSVGRGRGKRRISGMSTSALMPSDDEDDS